MEKDFSNTSETVHTAKETKPIAQFSHFTIRRRPTHFSTKTTLYATCSTKDKNIMFFVSARHGICRNFCIHINWSVRNGRFDAYHFRIY